MDEPVKEDAENMAARPKPRASLCNSICLAMQQFGYTTGNRLENFRCVLNEGHAGDHNKDGLYWLDNGEFSELMITADAEPYLPESRVGDKENDPDKVLSDLLEMAKKIGEDGEPPPGVEWLDYVIGFASRVEALDRWLVDGGQLPKRWVK